MIYEISGINATLGHELARNMFRDRKRVFADLLKWDVSIADNQFEIDQFDTSSATYIVATDESNCHRGSARLLPTTTDHILGTIFPNLCSGLVPRAPDCYEITRFCLSPSLTARERVVARKQLVTALAEYGLKMGIATYTGVAEKFWFDQIADFGWRCVNIGHLAAARHDLVALRIDLDQKTLGGLEARGMRTELVWNKNDWREAA
jgi:N-acyl-L-homoserine lactone synthetase